MAVRDFLRSGQDEAEVVIAPPNQIDCTDYQCAHTATTVRLARVITPNGRVQVVMTSLLGPVTHPAADFADLYHSRWRIEEAFKRLKHRLALAVMGAERQNPLPANHKINRTYAFAHLKRCLPRWLLGLEINMAGRLLGLAEIAKNLIRFVPNASKKGQNIPSFTVNLHTNQPLEGQVDRVAWSGGSGSGWHVSPCGRRG